MNTPSHPPRPGVRRFVAESQLLDRQAKREFAAAVKAIETCGLAAEIVVKDMTIGANYDPKFILYATRRVRTGSTER